jgi:hypothetical protein
LRLVSLHSRSLLWLSLLAAVLFGITAIPYAIGATRAPSGMVFSGILSWNEDQDMYFSFIRQGADGHLLFRNRLTSIEHEPVFFNLEWLMVGWILKLCGGSTDLAYHIWRAAGTLAVVLGFWSLAQVTLQDPVQRRVALLMGLFGGTLNWFFVALRLLSQAAERLVGAGFGEISVKFPLFATHPYGQILVNPHFALPLGVLMFALAAYLKGEQTGNWRWYAGAGGLTAVDGVMRPYDMIAFYTAIPVFILAEKVLRGRIEWRKLKLRLLPLLLVAPVFLYTVYLFDIHPVFRYWATQGSGTYASIVSTLAHIGLAAVLLAVRLCRVRAFPFNTSSERLLLVWLGTVFFLVHSNAIPMFRFMPYTPQLGTILMPPIILLGVAVIDPARWKRTEGRRLLPALLLGGLVVLNSLDSAVLTYSATPREGVLDKERFIPATELAAYEWLGREASETDVVLGVRRTGYRLAKYASVQVVSGHWSVTPTADLVEMNTRAFYAGRMTPQGATEFLNQMRVDWIYVGQNERWFGVPPLDQLPGLTKHVINDDVTVYRYTRRAGE